MIKHYNDCTPQMTSLRERLERKIESEADAVYKPLHPAWSGSENEAYKDGAHSLLPLVLELAEALDGVFKNKNSNKGDWHRCREALQAIEKFVGDEK